MIQQAGSKTLKHIENIYRRDPLQLECRWKTQKPEKDGRLIGITEPMQKATFSAKVHGGLAL